jgi:hypothetical protein
MEIRELQDGDLDELLRLYAQLHNNDMPVIEEKLPKIWNEILSDKNHHIVGGFIGGRLISSCVVVIIPRKIRIQ